MLTMRGTYLFVLFLSCGQVLYFFIATYLDVGLSFVGLETHLLEISFKQSISSNQER